MYVYYLAMPRKVQKQIQNYLKRAETIVILIVFNDVPSDVRTYILKLTQIKFIFPGHVRILYIYITPITPCCLMCINI
jgi:hypothetical protein